MSLFVNAIESIQIGVEDLLENDDRRVLSAVRNVHLAYCCSARKSFGGCPPMTKFCWHNGWNLGPTALEE
jgi:hypothetical protein